MTIEIGRVTYLKNTKTQRHKDTEARDHRFLFARLCVFVSLCLCVSTFPDIACAQNDVQPTNTQPNPYQTVTDWAKLPAGRTWGSTSAVEIDKDGRSVWVAERCGANSCQDSMLHS